MTPELIELEFAHIALDRKLKNGNVEQYEDPDFEDYDKETEDHDSKLSEDGDLPYYETPSTKHDEDQWEDVSIDD